MKSRRSTVRFSGGELGVVGRAKRVRCKRGFRTLLDVLRRRPRFRQDSGALPRGRRQQPICHQDFDEPPHALRHIPTFRPGSGVPRRALLHRPIFRWDSDALRREHLRKALSAICL